MAVLPTYCPEMTLPKRDLAKELRPVKMVSFGMTNASSLRPPTSTNQEAGMVRTSWYSGSVSTPIRMQKRCWPSESGCVLNTRPTNCTRSTCMTREMMKML